MRTYSSELLSIVRKSRWIPLNSKQCSSGPSQQRKKRFKYSWALLTTIVDLLSTRVLRHALLSTWRKMFPSLENIYDSKPSMHFEEDSSHPSSSPNLIELWRQSWKPMLAIKQLLVFCINTMLSMDANSLIQFSSMQNPSQLYNTTGQSIIKNFLLL